MSPVADIHEIQRLQFNDLPQAEELTRLWLADNAGIAVMSVRLFPSAVALNSFKGEAVLDDGSTVLFKSHTEPDSTVERFYDYDVMIAAGYNVQHPVHVVRERDQQVVIYPKIDAPTIFELVRTYETEGDESIPKRILSAQARACSALLSIYKANARMATAAEAGVAPIHQLFWHRLTGARFAKFYAGTNVNLPDGTSISMAELMRVPWVINGVEQPRTLQQLFEEAAQVLNPAQPGLVVPGHGDAHFGNTYLDDNTDILYVTPVVAGNHSPLLDITKPLFHNTLARWMYYPDEVSKQVSMQVELRDGKLHIEYGPHLSRYRQRLYETINRDLVEPTLQWMAENGALPNGRRPLDLALMCCPLLTVNLSDASKYPPTASWLGFALAMQMGNGDVAQELRTAPEFALPPTPTIIQGIS